MQIFFPCNGISMLSYDETSADVKAVKDNIRIIIQEEHVCVYVQIIIIHL